MQVNLHIITLSGKPVSGVWVTNDAENSSLSFPDDLTYHAFG